MERQHTEVNLIPENGPDTGNYWCTWDTQYRMNSLEDGKSSLHLRNILDDDFLFGSKKLITEYFQNVRKDIYVLLDDGWDVPRGIPGNGKISVFGSLILHEDRFPEFTGEPWERLHKIRNRVKELGYRGLGLWICANAAGEAEADPFTMESAREYWKERAIWCRKAGVDYWKVDWGYHSGDNVYRDMMTETVKQYAPDLKIEHAVCRWAMDEQPLDSEMLAELLGCCDFYRTYDVTREFNYSTAIRRAWEALSLTAPPRYGCEEIINVEDAPYLAAGLGCSMGIMRHPAWGGTQTDVLGFGLKYNEVERALHWQRIAPPFGAVRAQTQAAKEKLTDWTSTIDGPDGKGWLSHVFDRQDTIQEKAPRMLARNMEFPAVYAEEEELPFIVCSRHPQNGAVSLAFLPRTIGERKHVTPKVDAALTLGALERPVGIFGEFRTLTISLGEEIHGRIFLQDLCREHAVDVTDLVVKGKNLLELHFDELMKKGWLDNDPGDLSAPGFMICQID